MRIDAYNKVNQIYQTTAVNKPVKKSKTGDKDTLEVSNLGRDLQIAKKAVNNAPDLRMDKVDAIKTAMASGTYKIGAEEVADRLLEHFFDESI